MHSRVTGLLLMNDLRQKAQFNNVVLRTVKSVMQSEQNQHITNFLRGKWYGMAYFYLRDNRKFTAKFLGQKVRHWYKLCSIMFGILTFRGKATNNQWYSQKWECHSSDDKSDTRTTVVMRGGWKTTCIMYVLVGKERTKTVWTFLLYVRRNRSSGACGTSRTSEYRSKLQEIVTGHHGNSIERALCLRPASRYRL